MEMIGLDRTNTFQSNLDGGNIFSLKISLRVSGDAKVFGHE